MEDTQDLSARVTKLQENVLRWEDRFHSQAAEPTAFRQAVRELRSALTTLVGLDSNGWRKPVTSPTTRWYPMVG